MEWDRQQLAALAAAVDHGTFDAAAVALHVTPSAVSQRIRALEAHTGQVVVTRGRPCLPTETGRHLLRLARQLALLEAETAGALAAGAGVADLAVCVNADSLATWFHGVFTAATRWADARLTVHVEDQGTSTDLLRAGTVLAAVTSEPQAVQGCSVADLGVMRYIPVAVPALADRFRTGNRTDWHTMPALRFNAKDRLQATLLAAVAPGARPPTHQIPASADFAAAVRCGLGWALLPEQQIGSDLVDGSLVRLAGRRHLDVPLHWQRWRLSSEPLDRLSAAVLAAAAASLRPSTTRIHPS